MAPPRKNRQNFNIFSMCSVHGKNCPGWPQMGPGDFFPTNPDLANILGRTDLIFETFYFFDFLDPKILDFQVPNLKNSGFSGPQISKFPKSQISRFQDFQTPPTPTPTTTTEELSDPNLTPLPTHPGIKYVARALAATNSPSNPPIVFRKYRIQVSRPRPRHFL